VTHTVRISGVHQTSQTDSARIYPKILFLRYRSCMQNMAATLISQLAASNDAIKLRAIQMGALPTLLALLQKPGLAALPSKNNVAEAVRVLMKGVLAGEGADEAAKARCRAIPIILGLLEDAPPAVVQKRLTAALESFSPGAARKVRLALDLEDTSA